MEKLGRAVRIDDAVRAPIIEVVIVTTLLLTFSSYSTSLILMTVIMTRIVTLVLSSSFSCGCARTHALDEALDAGDEDCDQLPRRNLLEQHRAAAALEARLRARKGRAASYTHQEPQEDTSSGLPGEYWERGKPAPAGVHVARQPTTSTN